MVATRAPSSRAVARALVACAVLAGLFLMHGLTASSCAAPVGAVAPSMTNAMAGHPGSPVSVSDAASPTDPGGAMAGMAGGTCVSIPPPASDLAGLLALSLLAVAVIGRPDGVGSPSAAGRFRRGGGRRGPPLAGSGLLLSLCVSRT